MTRQTILRIVAASLMTVTIQTQALAYEVDTHRELSHQAVLRSRLAAITVQRDSLLRDFGLDDGGNYSDPLYIPLMGNTIPDWVELGSDQEDSENILRPRNHFYNPLNGQGLTSGLITGLPSPRWGLEDAGDNAGQDHSMKDARDYFYGGLTLSTEVERKTSLAKTFRALGQVIHLVQDAGQPQHTRNDTHVIESTLGSGYEAHTEERRKAGTLIYDGYPIPVFSYAYQYWYTANGGGNGLAEYSNRNFVSSGTNFQTGPSGVPCPPPSVPGFPSPTLNPQTERIEDVATAAANLQEPTSNLRGKLLFFTNSISDTYNSKLSGTNNYQTSHSIFHHALKSLYPNTCYYAFALNRFTHAAAEKFLIPRAVAYSAGLLDHFFRGDLEISGLNVANGQLEVTIKNVSTAGNNLVNGNFELWYESTDGTLKSMQVLNNSGAVGSTGVAVGRTRAVTAIYPSDLNCSRRNYFRVVYRGIIGKDEGVTGKVFNEESLITTRWVFDYKKCLNIPPEEPGGNETKDCICSDAVTGSVGVSYYGGQNGGLPYYYTMGVNSFYTAGCPIEYNYFKDTSYYHINSHINGTGGTWSRDYIYYSSELLFSNNHPYSNADSETLNVTGHYFTSFTTSFVARKSKTDYSSGFYTCQ